MVQSLNDLNYLAFAVLFRSFFEMVLLLRQYWSSRILPVTDAAVKVGLITSNDLSQLVSDLSMAVRRSKASYGRQNEA
jgi:hypothetical protein